MKKLLPVLLIGLLVGLASYGVRMMAPTQQSLAYGPEAKTAEMWKQERAEQKAADKRAGAVKSDGPDEFYQYHRDIRTPEGAEGPEYPTGFLAQELGKLQQLQFRGEASPVNAVWKERGPNNVAGRARALIVDPDDANFGTWFVGTAGGGIWKTTNTGASWTNLSPDFPNLAITTLAMASSNHDVIYAGSGEGFFNGDAIRGNGIFKSTDRGVTWTHVASTISNPDFHYVNKILVDPVDENKVYAANNAGIYLSEDGGASWTELLAPAGRVQDLDMDPSNSSRMYACVNSTGVYRSDDAGQTWALASSGIASTEGSIRRIELDISPVDNNIIYVSAEVASGADQVFRTTDGGDTWNRFGQLTGSPIEYLGGQGWYDNAIVAHPYDADQVFVAGVEIFDISFNGSITETDPTILGASSNAPFMTFVNFGGEYLGGGLMLGSATESINFSEDDWTSVEVRFGPGLSQKAHRFTVPANGGTNGDGGAGVPASDYTYEDYVDVPFEVWDVDNNIQLNVSFRDQEADGAFDLEAGSDSDGSRAREYFFISATPYDAENANSDITGRSAGHTYKMLYFIWPRLASGSTWTPNDLPESQISVDYGVTTVAGGTATAIADPYGRFNSSNPGVHPDHHSLYMIPKDPGNNVFWLLNLNDGGGSLSTNNGTVINQFGNTMHTTQFYGADKAPGATRYIGGTQDNGTWVSPAGTDPTASTDYTFSIGGDGFEAIWNFGDANRAIGGFQYNGFRRTNDGGSTWVSATSGMSDVGAGSAPFISRLGNSKSRPDYLYVVGPSGVWVSGDFGGTWRVTDMGEFWGFGSRAQVAASAANPSIVWAGSGMSSTGNLHVSKDYGATFTPVSNFTGFTNFAGSISGLDPHPTEDSTAFATFSFFGYPHILRTEDMGQTWEDITQVSEISGESANGFPNVATYCVIAMPHMPEVLWAGTEIGIVESTDNGATWHMLEGDFPMVSVWDMKITESEIVVATHGRGIWSAVIDELPEIGVVPELLVASLDADADLAMNVQLGSPFDSSYVYADGQLLFQLEATPAGAATISGPFGLDEGTYDVVMVGYLNGKAFTSDALTSNLARIAPVTTYTTSFSPGMATDFYGDGFSVTTADGFGPSDYAIHSNHPYATADEFTFQLLVPIIIADTLSYLYYEDIAIIEPGEAGTVFGDDEFWDYVVVEGSSDGGLTWTPLADGYDSDASVFWSSAYDNGSTPNSNMYVPQLINLHDTYSPGDTVYFRFRLFSDPAVVGWGWVIDELSIQDPAVLESVLGIKDIVDVQLSLFPNPTQERFTVSYTLEDAMNVEIMVTDLQGRVIMRQSQGLQAPGNHKQSFDLNQARPGQYMVTVQGAFGRQTTPLIVR